jgi:hypothetical protein
MEISMDATDYFDELEPANIGPIRSTKDNISGSPTQSLKTDIHLWLSDNAPRIVEELKDIRYTLYHRCSRSDFKVSEKQDKDEFQLSGRQSSVHIVSNNARRYLLWKLRILARERGWVGRKRNKLVAVG